MKNTKTTFNHTFPGLNGILITTQLRDRNDHFVVTIYKKYRRTINIEVGDIAIINLRGEELIRPVRRDFHVALPKKLLKDKHHGDDIEFYVSLAKPDNCVKRPSKEFYSDLLDVRSLIPKRTVFGRPLYVIKRSEQYSSVWYSHGSGVRHITIKNFIDSVKIAELMGFYYGDGTTCEGIQSFRLTNCEPSILNHCLDTLEILGVGRDQFKAQIIYSTDTEVTNEIKNRCINYWSKTLGLNIEKIVSVTKSKNIRETKRYGSARIFIDSTVLVEILLRGVMEHVLKKISKPQERIDYELLKGFMRGLLAAEGSVQLNKQGSVVRVGIAFDPHSEELGLYKVLLKNLGIAYKRVGCNEILIQKYVNMRKLHDIRGFARHDARNTKFTEGFRNHRFFKTHYLV